MPHVNAWDPNPDLDAAATLGDALRAVGYTHRGDRRAARRRRARRPTSPSRWCSSGACPRSAIATTIRLLLLQRPSLRADAAAALGRDGVAALPQHRARHDRRRTARPTCAPRARPRGMYLAFDGFSRGQDDPPGWVSSFTPTAYWLASLTPRRRVERALDIGTGNGAHALLAAAHADHVIATDVNARALAFTQISAALNGIDNVETRLGSLFEPVAGETFDLITCNAPYVISPERALAVPRRRPARRPAVRARRARGRAPPRRRRPRIGARQLARGIGGRPGRAHP